MEILSIKQHSTQINSLGSNMVVIYIFIGFLLKQVFDQLVDAIGSRVALNGLADKYQNLGAAKLLVEQADELMKQQYDLFTQMQQPNKNAMHARYKNDISLTIRDLEAKKIDIFEKLVKRGHDMTIHFQDETGTLKPIKMSEAIKAYRDNSKTPPPLPPTGGKIDKPTLKVIK